MNWTEERVELLKQLWAEGHSASQIAVKMGGVTRNAVIGKAHRLKLAGRMKTQPRLHSPQTAGAENTVAGGAAIPETAAAARGASGGGAAGVKARAGGMARHAGRAAVRTEGNAALNMEFVADAVAETQIEPKKRKGVVVPIARPRHLSLMQLTEHTCKWPLGDPMSDDFSFCGVESDDSGPYCSLHAKMAFNSAADKRKNSG